MPAVFADDTPVKMQTPSQKGVTTARVWAYVADQRGFSGTEPPCAWYRFTTNRKVEHPAEHLSGFKGHVHADGYSGFNTPFETNHAHEMACMAHIRRKFVDVQVSQGSAIAAEAIERIAALYAVEKDARGRPPMSEQGSGKLGPDPCSTAWNSGCASTRTVSPPRHRWARLYAMH